MILRCEFLIQSRGQEYISNIQDAHFHLGETMVRAFIPLICCPQMISLLRLKWFTTFTVNSKYDLFSRVDHRPPQAEISDPEMVSHIKMKQGRECWVCTKNFKKCYSYRAGLHSQDSNSAMMPVIIFLDLAVQRIRVSTFTLACSHKKGKVEQTVSLALQIVQMEQIQAATSWLNYF